MQSDNQMYLKINVAEEEIKFQATVQDNNFAVSVIKAESEQITWIDSL